MLVYGGAPKMRPDSGLVGVALDQAAARAIGALQEVVAQGGCQVPARFRDHLFRDGLKLGELTVVNVEVKHETNNGRCS